MHCIVQTQPLGTGHAASVALNELDQTCEDVLILCGDTPLLSSETLQSLADHPADYVVLTADLPLDQLHLPYGRVVYHEGDPVDIVEYKDASKTIQSTRSINAGVYKIKQSLLRKILPLVSDQNKSNEYYLTDTLKLAIQEGAKVAALNITYDETLGVNTREDLAAVDEIFQQRLRKMMMANGVTLLQPHTIRLSVDTKIGTDTVINPFVVIGNGVTIGENVHIYSHTALYDCIIKDGAKVGPFAHLRGKTVLDEGAEVGNFVELKKTTLGKKSKVKHLSYLGDATVGDACNIGAGTITANYDGTNKHQTLLGNHVHVGAQTVFVAPVSVGDGAVTGAGTTVTSNVPANALAIDRTPQINKENWALKRKSIRV
jgi:bifunctional UDP-N-acetylglucosamine pyrophosphorylase/glucosamine-1-phosphate N-acetyltransferase